MALLERSYGLVIVGGGPAGLAPLVAAHRAGRLDELLDAGIAIIDKDDRIGSGSIGHYAINSDSGGRTFVDCLDGTKPSALTDLQQHPLTQRLAAAGDGPVPLQEAGQFLGLVGEAIGRIVRAHPACSVLTKHEALAAQQTANGWRLEIRPAGGAARRRIAARRLVIAAGAHQPPQRLMTEMISGRSLANIAGSRLMQSGEVLTTEGLARVGEILAQKAAPRVAIIGGSTSAAAVAHALLHRLPHIGFGERAITLLHRRPLRIYYPDRAAALAENYAEWTEEDVCQVSGRVFRFAGFRLDSRELVMQARGIGGRPPEPRLSLHQLGEHDETASRIVAGADIVVAALGYRPRALPLHDAAGSPIMLHSQTGPQAPLVDSLCRVLDGSALPLRNIYGIGLAAGFVPRGKLGGEVSFRGQANGLWLWQHDVGAIIANGVLDGLQAEMRDMPAGLSALGSLMRPSTYLPTPLLYG